MGLGLKVWRTSRKSLCSVNVTTKEASRNPRLASFKGNTLKSQVTLANFGEDTLSVAPEASCVVLRSAQKATGYVLPRTSGRNATNFPCEFKKRIKFRVRGVPCSPMWFECNRQLIFARSGESALTFQDISLERCQQRISRSLWRGVGPWGREIFIDSLLVRVHFIIEINRPALRHGSLNSLFKVALYLPS